MAPDGAEVDARRVEARPEKRFFIDMLVKDIELIPAIVDFVDNSVDSARAMVVGGDLTGRKVEIEATPERFEVVDNCAGISTEVARRYAFHFGRPENFEGIAHSVGQFGVGMKRALFKLGRAFEIESRTESSYFLMREQVERWAADPSPDWSFSFEDFDDDRPLAEGESAGTRIRIDPLLPSVADDFDSYEVLSSLRADLELRHERSLEAGLEIVLNGERLTPRPPLLLASNDFGPIRMTYEVGTNGDTVAVELFAGVVRGAEEEPDSEEAERFTREGEAGWYLFCNDRLVFAAERTGLTGWGDGAAAYHPQYRNFRGYAFLSAQSAGLLPWNTTKTSVDRDDQVWRTVRGEMKSSLRKVQTVMNRLKRERQELAEGDRPLTSVVAAAAETPLHEIPASENVRAPDTPAPERNVRRISYSVERERFEAVRETLDAEAPKDVGHRTFEYFYEREVQ
jgi:Histidine kinase-, DNA gyrase B-, and HSP90-like ATPase